MLQYLLVIITYREIILFYFFRELCAVDRYLGGGGGSQVTLSNLGYIYIYIFLPVFCFFSSFFFFYISDRYSSYPRICNGVRRRHGGKGGKGGRRINGRYIYRSVKRLGVE